MIEKLKTFSAARYDLEELVVLSAYAKMASAEFESLSIDKPSWLVEAQAGIGHAIKSLTTDAMKARLAAAKARVETLKTPDQKRQDAMDEVKRLEAALGIPASTTTSA